MTHLNLAISDDMQCFVEAEAAASGYASAADYVCALLEAMHRQKSYAHLERTLVDRIEGPPAIELTADVWADLQARVHRRLAAADR